MSARDELRAFEASSQDGVNSHAGDDTPEAMQQELTDLLGASQVGRRLVGIHVFGRGPAASVDIQLSGDVKITFERFADVSKPTALTAHLSSYAGIGRTFKATEAARVAALIHRLARHHGGESADEAAREWGSEFLRLANKREFDLNDQADKWRAFSLLERLNPAHDAGEDRTAHSLACACVVIVHQDTNIQLVRCGWFLSYVRREVGGMYSPATLGTQMERVGWQRRGGEGRIKATCPTDGRTLNWRFYVAPKGWGE